MPLAVFEMVFQRVMTRWGEENLATFRADSEFFHSGNSSPLPYGSGECVGQYPFTSTSVQQVYVSGAVAANTASISCSRSELRRTNSSSISADMLSVNSLRAFRRLYSTTVICNVFSVRS